MPVTQRNHNFSTARLHLGSQVPASNLLRHMEVKTVSSLLQMITLAVMLSISSPAVWAQDFAKGAAAAKTGDYEAAMDEWIPLAQRGYPEAQFNLGWLFENGLGVPQDYAEAMAWYQKAADQNYPEAQLSIGWLYSKGFGVSQDDSKAARWYRKAAEQGNAIAQSQLGVLYSIGAGVQQDYVAAVKWYRMAAVQGDTLSQYNLGLMYENGLGVRQDNVLAYVWYDLAGSKGHAQGVEFRNRVAAQMTPEAISKAKHLASECAKKHHKDC